MYVDNKNGICFYFGVDLGKIFRCSRHLKDGYFVIVKRKKAPIRTVNALFQNILTEIQVSMWNFWNKFSREIYSERPYF